MKNSNEFRRFLRYNSSLSYLSCSRTDPAGRLLKFLNNLLQMTVTVTVTMRVRMTVTVTVTVRVIVFTYLRLKGLTAERGYVNTVE